MKMYSPSLSIILRLFIFFLIFNYFIFADNVVKVCDSDGFLNNATDVQYGNCTTSPCKYRRGTNITVRVSFIAEKSYRRLSHILYAEYQGVKLNHPEMHGKTACNDVYSYPDKVKVGCPLEEGTHYILEATNYINTTLPKIPRVLLHWAIRDQDAKKDMLCYEVIARII